MSNDEQDFVLGEPPPGINGRPSASPEEPAGDSGVLVVQPPEPGMLAIAREGSRAIVRFNHKEVIGELCLAAYREQLFGVLQDPECRIIQFQVAGIEMFPSGMLGLLASIKKRGCDIELVDPSSGLLEVLQVTRLDSLVTIRRTGT